jgi:hypothetical protein
MRISHLKNKDDLFNNIEVRNYDNKSIVHYPTNEPSKDKDNLVGVWNPKKIFFFIPKEYNYLNENITFLPK